MLSRDSERDILPTVSDYSDFELRKRYQDLSVTIFEEYAGKNYPCVEPFPDLIAWFVTEYLPNYEGPLSHTKNEFEAELLKRLSRIVKEVNIDHPEIVKDILRVEFSMAARNCVLRLLKIIYPLHIPIAAAVSKSTEIWIRIIIIRFDITSVLQVLGKFKEFKKLSFLIELLHAVETKIEKSRDLPER